MPTTQTPSSLEQQFTSLPRFPHYGVWNLEEGWLIDHAAPIADGDSMWTKESSQAQVFRTEAKALLATKHLRDFAQVNTAVRQLDHAIR